MRKNIFMFAKKHKLLSVLMILLLFISSYSIVSFTLFEFKMFENNKFLFNIFGTVNINQNPVTSDDKAKDISNSEQKISGEKILGKQEREKLNTTNTLVIIPEKPEHETAPRNRKQSEQTQLTKIIPPKTENIILGAEISGVLNKQGNTKTYEFNIPDSVRLWFSCQAGETDSSKIIYNISLHKKSDENLQLLTHDIASYKDFHESKSVFVTPGNYCAVIQAYTDNEIAYHFKILTEEAENIEIENNDTTQRAVPIKIGTTYDGSLATEQDKDFYRFELDSDCGVNIILKLSDSNSEAFKLEVSNSNHILTSKTDEQNKSSSLVTGNLYLRKGEYFVRVSPWRKWIDKPYSLTVKTVQKRFIEAETNNSERTSNHIPVNQEINASTGYEEDVDYFDFTLEKNSLIIPSLTFDEINSDLKVYSLCIDNDSYTENRVFDFLGNGNPSREIKPFRLRAGKYFAIVKRIERKELAFSLHEYSLQINAELLE